MDINILLTAIIALLAGMLMLCLRWISKALGIAQNTNSKAGKSPEETSWILTNAVNEAIKLKEDRERKRLSRASEPGPEDTIVPPEVPPDALKKMWEFYKKEAEEAGED